MQFYCETSNDAVCPSGGRSVDLMSVCNNFLKGREVSHPGFRIKIQLDLVFLLGFGTGSIFQRTCPASSMGGRPGGPAGGPAGGLLESKQAVSRH